MGCRLVKGEGMGNIVSRLRRDNGVDSVSPFAWVVYFQPQGQPNLVVVAARSLLCRVAYYVELVHARSRSRNRFFLLFSSLLLLSFFLLNFLLLFAGGGAFCHAAA